MPKTVNGQINSINSIQYCDGVTYLSIHILHNINLQTNALLYQYTRYLNALKHYFMYILVRKCAVALVGHRINIPLRVT